MRIGMDASVEANGPKEESKARTCGLGCGRIISSSGIEVTAQPRTIADQLTRLLRAVIGASLENTMKRHFVTGMLLAALIFAGSARLSAQDSLPGDWQKYLIPDGQTVYDVFNRVTWLADANLVKRSDSAFRYARPPAK